MKVNALIEQIDLGKLALPAFQRGYVWSPNQVRGLMGSLHQQYPVGSLLVWETAVDEAAVRGDGAMPTGGWVDLLLDGQQRITSLYGQEAGTPEIWATADHDRISALGAGLRSRHAQVNVGRRLERGPH